MAEAEAVSQLQIFDDVKADHLIHNETRQEIIQKQQMTHEELQTITKHVRVAYYCPLNTKIFRKLFE